MIKVTKSYTLPRDMVGKLGVTDRSISPISMYEADSELGKWIVSNIPKAVLTPFRGQHGYIKVEAVKSPAKQTPPAPEKPVEKPAEKQELKVEEKSKPGPKPRPKKKD